MRTKTDTWLFDAYTYLNNTFKFPEEVEELAGISSVLTYLAAGGSNLYSELLFTKGVERSIVKNKTCLKY